MRRLLVALLIVTGSASVVRGIVPCDALPTQPACTAAFYPGPTRNTLDLVEIAGDMTSVSSGELVLTTVLVDTDLDLREWVEAITSDRILTVNRDLVLPPGEDQDDVDRKNEFLMHDSQFEATLAALAAAGYDVSTEPIGVEIVSLADPTGVTGEQLLPEDRLVAVDGRPVTSIDDVLDALDGVTPGDAVVVTRKRDADVSDERITTIANPTDPTRPLIGVLLRHVYDLPVDVTIDAGRIGGPSAGLMFALSIVDILDPEDLTGGHVIAGTGTINAEGTVSAIGGVRQKILGAVDRGEERPATVFLVPASNAEEARQAPVRSSILLVPVSTLADALEALAVLRSGGTPTGAVALGPTP